MVSDDRLSGRLFDGPATPAGASGEGRGPDPGPARRPEGSSGGARSPSAPLAERMRPAGVDEFVGQSGAVGGGSLVGQILAGGEPTSLVLWGPPGSGKTTLARLLADACDAHFVALSAVLSGVREVRSVAEDARRLRAHGRRTLLFLDEIHRFNKAQQDALLPHLETGDLVLIGATTENPSFELVAPLLSRCKVVTLERHGRQELVDILRRALDTPAPRGLGGCGVEVADDTLASLADLADGDARVALNTLDLAVRMAATGDGRVDREVLTRAMQRRLPPMDREGEEHFNLLSALHKSVRSSDADAALYWLARLLEGGADPRMVGRRLVRMASEDVGLADPRALGIATAGVRAFEVQGMPEGALALAQVAVFLALAPKSDALYRGYGAATEDVARGPCPPVPLHLRNAPTRLMRDLGYGRGYRHAHDEPGGLTSMTCLPEELAERRYYRPVDRGDEVELGRRIARIRELRGRDRREAEAPEEPPDPSSGPA